MIKFQLLQWNKTLYSTKHYPHYVGSQTYQSRKSNHYSSVFFSSQSHPLSISDRPEKAVGIGKIFMSAFVSTKQSWRQARLVSTLVSIPPTEKTLPYLLLSCSNPSYLLTWQHLGSKTLLPLLMVLPLLARLYSHQVPLQIGVHCVFFFTLFLTFFFSRAPRQHRSSLLARSSLLNILPGARPLSQVSSPCLHLPLPPW